MASEVEFAADAGAARELFRAAAVAAGAAVVSHPAEAGDGGAATVDVATLGPAGAPRVLLMVSGTGGIEAFAGAAVQVAWLRRHAQGALPAGCRAILVHGLNAYGFNSLRRVDDNNVDLDRNFLDFDQPLPDNPGYEALAPTLAPLEWDEIGERVNRRVWAEFIAREGERAFLDGVSGGQYRHADGIYYGGKAASRPHRLLRELVTAQLDGCRRLLLVDLRTGPGAFGEAEVICRHDPDGDDFARALAWFGSPVHSPQRGDTLAPVATGTLLTAVPAWAPPPARVTAVAMRFGTGPEDKVFAAVRADNWLTHHGDPASPRGLAIKAQLVDAFAPDDAAWRRAVLEQGRAVLDRGLRGLAGGRVDRD